MSTLTRAPGRAATVPSLLFSTDRIPERDRVAVFREEFAAKMLRVEMDFLGSGTPRYQWDYVQSGPVGISTVEGTRTRMVRRREQLSDANDNYTLAFVQAGAFLASQDGRSVQLMPGDAVLLANDRALEMSSFGDGKTWTLQIERRALDTLVARPDEACARRLPRSEPSLRLMAGYLSTLAPLKDALDPRLIAAFGEHLVDVVATLLRPTRDGREKAENGGVKAARLTEILRAIAAHADDSSFSVDVAGRRLGLSPRHVHRLLEETGKTFNEHLVERRLQQAWRLLTDPRHTHLKVATIAFDAGFGDLSHFNRAFRRRFGDRPSSVRAGAAAS